MLFEYEEKWGKAYVFANEAHDGQTDLNGDPYIQHPYRVSMDGDVLESFTEQIVALLHDVLEDTDVTYDEIEEEFGEEVAETVGLLTRGPDDTYEEYIRILSYHDMARRVKIADLKDNMKLWRISDPSEKDWERWRKYHKWWRFLTDIEEENQ